MNKANVTLGFSFGLLLCAAMVLFQAQAEAPSGGGTPSLTATQVAYGSATGTLTSEAAFNYNATTDTLAASTIQTGTIRDSSGNQQMFYSTVSGSQWLNQAAATVNPMFSIENTNTVTSGRVLRIRSGSTDHFILGPGFTVDSTDSTGTPGAATINKASGKSAIAIGAASVVVTNSLVAATSRVFIQPTETDTTCYPSGGANWIVVAGAGSFTVTAPATCTAATNFDWFVVQ